MASSHAYELSFQPAAQTVGLGSQATVDVRISGVLPDGLGAYDFDVTFDPDILAFDHAVDGLGLGLAIGLGASPNKGSVTLSDFSLETPVDLIALQSDEFVLLSLVFDTLNVGTSELAFDFVTLGDAFGNRVSPAALTQGIITVRATPEPASIALVLAALLLATAAAFGRRRS